MRSSARPLQPVLIRREGFIERRPRAREILRHRGPWPRRTAQQPCLQLDTLLTAQQVVDWIEHHGVRPCQPIRPPAATVFPTAAIRGQGHCQAVEPPQLPPEGKPPTAASPDLLPVKGLVSSNRPRLNLHGARCHGKQGRCDCIPAGWWWALRGDVWGLWREPGGGRLAGAAGAFRVKRWAQFSAHIHQKQPQAAWSPHRQGWA